MAPTIYAIERKAGSERLPHEHRLVNHELVINMLAQVCAGREWRLTAEEMDTGKKVPDCTKKLSSRTEAT